MPSRFPISFFHTQGGRSVGPRGTFEVPHEVRTTRGYWQVPLDKESVLISAFVAPLAEDTYVLLDTIEI